MSGAQHSHSHESARVYPLPPVQVGRKIALQKDRRAVVLACVDASDFDGSLPREALA